MSLIKFKLFCSFMFDYSIGMAALGWRNNMKGETKERF
jgi:hypothetical protein